MVAYAILSPIRTDCQFSAKSGSGKVQTNLLFVVLVTEMLNKKLVKSSVILIGENLHSLCTVLRTLRELFSDVKFPGEIEIN